MNSILNEKKIIIAEWRDERAKHGSGGHTSAADGDALIIDDQNNSFDRENKTNKFDAEALAEKRALVEEWRKKKISEQSELEV